MSYTTNALERVAKAIREQKDDDLAVAQVYATLQLASEVKELRESLAAKATAPKDGE